MFETIGYQKYSEGKDFVKVNTTAQDSFLVTADGKFLLTEDRRGENTSRQFITI